MSAGDTPREGTRTDDRRDRTLPITEEVGSEGGSYADPTSQTATFGGPDAPPTADRESPSPASGDAIDRAAVSAGGVGAAPGPESGMVRYPTEPPSPPSAREGWKAASRWKPAALAAAAGAAAALLWRRR